MSKVIFLDIVLYKTQGISCKAKIQGFFYLLPVFMIDTFVGTE